MGFGTLQYVTESKTFWILFVISLIAIVTTIIAGRELIAMIRLALRTLEESYISYINQGQQNSQQQQQQRRSTYYNSYNYTYEEAHKRQQAKEKPIEPERPKVPECYTVFGFSERPEDFEEVKQVYRKKIKTLHPDAGGDEKEFIRVQEAYEAAQKEHRLHQEYLKNQAD